jgi:hypothetical protein
VSELSCIRLAFLISAVCRLRIRFLAVFDGYDWDFQGGFVCDIGDSGRLNEWVGGKEV